MTDSDAISLKSQQRRRHTSSARDGGIGRCVISLVWLYGFFIGSVIGVVGVALYVLLSPATDASTEGPTPTPDAVCYSPSCLATSEMLRENLNPLVAPCDDFQAHVCSRFWGPAQSLLLSELDSAVGNIAQSLRNLDGSVRGARRKAADMFRACERRYRDEEDQTVVLKELMARLRLSVSDPPPVGSLSTPDGLLKLHVELAFVYELSGLFFLRPAMPQSIRVAADLSFIHASEEFSAPDIYFKDLLHAIDPANTELANQGLALHNTMTLAVAAATRHRHGSSAPHFVKVRDVSFGGVSDGAFAAAVEEKTPYKGDSYVELDVVVPGALESVWTLVTTTDIYQWTSWQVLEECAAHVDPYMAHHSDAYAFFARCCKRVLLVLGPPAAAIEYFRLVAPEVQDRISRLIRSVARCLTTKATRWVREFDVQPVIGLPPSASTVQTLDARYESIPSGNGSSFFADWVRAAEERSRQVSPKDVHVDERQADVFMRPNAPGVLSCASADVSNATDFAENLLAYSCVLSTFEAANEPNKRLPMLGVLNPSPRLLLAVGCLKDCAVYGSMTSSSCRVSERHLEAFDEAFSCKSEQPRCAMQ
ncbi:hypothetical protein HPB52_007458 [Rhipicephalus sanguineus]|uniref:Uncharacterized protein n=1 Tax=Rhipicephalus sanguineus TaxID=34632 RepID=A0A9D4PCY3_RHISA|nr:hypothetical protein HPB52_007458 [Rhipicephalus sanguineus]